jgi:hypothetical protein
MRSGGVEDAASEGEPAGGRSSAMTLDSVRAAES